MYVCMHVTMPGGMAASFVLISSAAQEWRRRHLCIGRRFALDAAPVIQYVK